MRVKHRIHPLVVLPLAAAFLLQMNLQAQVKKSPASAQIKRGEYLVRTSGCNDCHSPKVKGPKGPVPPPMKLLSGAPAEGKVLAIPQGVLGPDKWAALTTNDMTTWAGPWGVTFAANLTPDAATGIGG